MPQAVLHFLSVVILLELFRDYFLKNKRHFPAHYILIGGLAGLLPDIDIALFYILSFFGFTGNQIHRTFMHTVFIPLIFVFLALIFHNFKSKKLGIHHLKLRNIFLVIAFGVLMHLILDSLIWGKIMPFYPFLGYSFGFNLVFFFPASWADTILPSIDAALLILWMIHLELRHKVSEIFE